MVTSTTTESVATNQVTTDHDDHHVYCCEDEDLGLCGLDLTTYSVDDGAETTCVVCADLDELYCEDFCPNAR